VDPTGGVQTAGSRRESPLGGPQHDLGSLTIVASFSALVLKKITYPMIGAKRDIKSRERLSRCSHMSMHGRVDYCDSPL